MQNLGTLGGDSSSALDLNNNGDVVGTSTAAMGARVSLVQYMQDLNTPDSYEFWRGAYISDRHQQRRLDLTIGAVTTDRSQPLDLDDTHHHAGPIHAFLLTPPH